jgi:mannose-6-phosphate isomerase-like protein (cupin superfamily)
MKQNAEISEIEQPGVTRTGDLFEDISYEDARAWLSTENLRTKNKRTLNGFEITDHIDGAAQSEREVSLVRLLDSQLYPQHVHKHSDAVFIIVDGEATLLSGPTKKVVKRGDKIPIPRGTPHGFRLAPGNFLEFISIQSPPIRNRKTGEEDLTLIDMA